MKIQKNKELILHVGMGKTGTSSIQKALQISSLNLLENGTEYLGQNFSRVPSEFSSELGSSFSIKESDLSVFSSELIAYMNKNDAISKYIISAETLLDRYEPLSHLAQELIRSSIMVKVLIFVRDPIDWLPSAYSQWALYHKTYKGEIKSFKNFAPMWMKRYKDVICWYERLPGDVYVHEFNKNTDAVKKFSEAANIELSSLPARVFERPDQIELLMRAAFNNNRNESTLPAAFERTMLYGGKLKVHNLHELYKNISSTDGIIEVIDDEIETILKIK